mmetsp:Transcript_144318/g.204073  ORF Transcript_144318/g.204073 Transcript_144318/m.204073 type:complete len:138 (+) Transcript_144318:23-436(+)
MSSGIDCTDECVDQFNDLKLKHTCKYIVYKITDDWTEIQVAKTGDKSSSYDDFLEELPENECRYAIYDYEFKHDDRLQSKILFIVWAPDTSKIKAKMLYASSKANFKKKLVGIGTEIQANDLAEIDEDAVKEKVTRV